MVLGVGTESVCDFEMVLSNLPYLGANCDYPDR